MKLPVVKIEAVPINWAGHTRRYMNPGELEVLVCLYREANVHTCLEIGCNEGRTSDVLMKNVPTIERYIGVDVPRDYVFSKRVQAREAPVSPGHLAKHDERFELIVRPRGSFELKPEELPVFDAVFIDGDHGARAVRHDMRLAMQSTKRGGLIIFHDYHGLGNVDVRDVLDDEYSRGAPLVKVDGTWIAYMLNPGPQ